MKYISTRSKAKPASFKEAIFAGLASDGGLYVPQNFPKFSKAQLAKMRQMSYPELFTAITFPFIANQIDRKAYQKLASETYAIFTHQAIAPLKQLDHNQFLLELFHGPTLAFKDFALQFLGKLLNTLAKNDELIVIGATSGDTGSAAIQGLLNCKSAKIFIMHPHEKVSRVQRIQMTTTGSDRVFNLAINGNFDDCQNMLKKIFSDHFSAKFLKGKKIIAVNSINWARIMAQIVYYFYATSRLDGPVSFVVPTGNFGDIYAGYLAKKMGANIKRLVIATNSNDILHRFLKSNDYSRMQLNHTISPSMDIQVSSNFERLLFDIYQKFKTPKQLAELMTEFEKTGKLKVGAKILSEIKKTFGSYAFDDESIKRQIKLTFEQTGEIVDPHTAIGLLAANSFVASKDYGGEAIVTLATAHPAKFPESVLASGVAGLPTPQAILKLQSLKENYDVVANDLSVVKEFISDKI